MTDTFHIATKAKEKKRRATKEKEKIGIEFT